MILAKIYLICFWSATAAAVGDFFSNVGVGEGVQGAIDAAKDMLPALFAALYGRV
jgi:hypothetical protein